MGQAQGQIPPQGEEEEEDPDAEPDWEPEDEELDAEETFTLRYLDQHRRNGCTEQAWRHQRAIFNETHPNGPQLLSLARAISLARTTLDQFSLKFDMCKFGHMSYGCEEYEDLEQCPFCDTPRYLPDPNDGAPPGAPLIPWTEKTPIRQWEYCSIIPTLQADFATAEGSEQACYRGRHHLDRANAKAAAAARGQPFPPPDYVYRNVTDGSGYEAACEDGRFDDKRTALLSFSWDGCLLLPGKDCWYVIILDFSLPPDVRYDLGEPCLPSFLFLPLSSLCMPS